MYQLRGETPHTTVYGEEGDISILGDFSFYEVIYYFDHKVPYPMARERMGRYLGPSTGVGNEMCSWLLKTNEKVIARRTIRPLNKIERNSEVEQNKIKLLNEAIRKLYGEYDNIPHMGVKINQPLNQYAIDEDESFDSKNQKQMHQWMRVANRLINNHYMTNS